MDNETAAWQLEFVAKPDLPKWVALIFKNGYRGGCAPQVSVLCREHAENAQRTCREHAENTQKTRREHTVIYLNRNCCGQCRQISKDG